MMSSDRRDDPQGGLLLYLREAAMKTIPANYLNKRGQYFLFFLFSKFLFAFFNLYRYIGQYFLNMMPARNI